METGLADRTVLVTGANSGIGAATARAFGREGARVVVHYLGAAEGDGDGGRDESRYEHRVLGPRAAEGLASEIRDGGAEATLVEADLADPTTIPHLFDRAGDVDVLVNNAAHCETPDDITAIAPESIDRHFSVNTRAPALLMAEFVRRYRERDGRSGSIVSVSTDSARAFATQLGYGASKAALEALTRSVAIEVGPYGITVNAVAPGPIQTGWIEPELEEEILPRIPMRRLGHPEDVADLIVFLASDRARWVTGQVIQVAGGHAL